jgi:hypothetical protein
MEKKTNDIPKPNKKNTISLKIAKNWAKRWRNMESSYNKHNSLKAFNIPKIDLQEVLAEDGVASIRAYIGVEKKTDTNGKPTYEEKLMIVGVNALNQDMITVPKSVGDSVTDPTDGDIYDFTKPCPTHCPPDSPLAD